MAKHHTVLALSIFLSAATNAWSWGSDAHQLVARIAQQGLTSKAQQEVQKLLDQEPGSTLQSISTWADETRNPATAAWHYINFPKGDCHYDHDRDCPDGKCVVEAINRQVEVLRTDSDPQRRFNALKYVVHLVGDVHQPLHAGWGEDRGGNTYQLQAFMRGSNLHAFWDSGMVRYYKEQESNWSQTVVQQAGTESAKPWAVRHAAEESCEIVRKDTFYPSRTVGSDYAEQYRATLTQRLSMAGSRLAQVLNGVWP